MLILLIVIFLSIGSVVATVFNVEAACGGGLTPKLLFIKKCIIYEQLGPPTPKIYS